MHPLELPGKAGSLIMGAGHGFNTPSGFANADSVSARMPVTKSIPEPGSLTLLFGMELLASIGSRENPSAKSGQNDSQIPGGPTTETTRSCRRWKSRAKSGCNNRLQHRPVPQYSQ